MGFPVSTRAQSDLINPAIWNADLVANMNAMPPHLLARKASNEDVTTTTLQDDNDFTLAVAANEVWQVFMSLLVVTGAGGMKSSWSFPASGEMTYTQVGADATAAALVQSLRLTATDAATMTYITNSTGRLFTLEGVYVNAGTAGNLVFRNALNTASGTSTLEANSTMWVVKLA